jgi:hypothetical protein
MDRDSLGYRAGRLAGKLILVGIGFLFGKRWGRKPIKKAFPEK